MRGQLLILVMADWNSQEDIFLESSVVSIQMDEGSENFVVTVVIDAPLHTSAVPVDPIFKEYIESKEKV